MEYSLFEEFMEQTKKEIEAVTEEYFDEFAEGASDNVFVKSSLEALREQNRGGKRIRGAVINLGEKIASNGKADNYLPIAVGYELLQTSILIHDDIIDKSEVRRGKATIHASTEKDIAGLADISKSTASHFGMSRALCAGDYGFFIALQFLGKCKADSEVLNRLYSLCGEILTTTCEGEIMDTALPVRRVSPLTDYGEYERIVTQIYESKTAWYTLAGPLMLGAVCGGASDELLALLKDMAMPLGVAFQIKDDLLGIYSSEETLGKSILSDIRENKQTLLYGYAYKNADERQRALLTQHYGNEYACAESLLAVREVFSETGAKKRMEEKIYTLSERSRALISNGLIGKKYQSLLDGLIDYLIYRKY